MTDSLFEQLGSSCFCNWIALCAREKGRLRLAPTKERWELTLPCAVGYSSLEVLGGALIVLPLEKLEPT